jgi:hypothetical protein
MDPLTKWHLPKTDAISGAKSPAGSAPAAPIAWTVNLPDRIDALKATADGVSALSHDGSLATISAAGKLANTKPLAAAEFAAATQELVAKPDAVPADIAKAQARADRMLKLSATEGGRTAVAYWGGTFRVVDAKGKIQYQQQLPQDVTALVWLAGKPIVGLANGQVLALDVK